MSVTLTVTDIEVGNQIVEVFGTVAVASNYPTGGDTVDWTALFGQQSVRGQIVTTSMTDPTFGPVQASFTVQGGTPNLYNLQQGSADNNWKMRGYTSGSGGAEFTGGSAYPSSASGDKIVFYAAFRKLT